MTAQPLLVLLFDVSQLVAARRSATCAAFPGCVGASAAARLQQLLHMLYYLPVQV